MPHPTRAGEKPYLKTNTKTGYPTQAGSTAKQPKKLVAKPGSFRADAKFNPGAVRDLRADRRSEPRSDFSKGPTEARGMARPLTGPQKSHSSPVKTAGRSPTYRPRYEDEGPNNRTTYRKKGGGHQS